MNVFKKNIEENEFALKNIENKFLKTENQNKILIDENRIIKLSINEKDNQIKSLND